MEAAASIFEALCSTTSSLVLLTFELQVFMGAPCDEALYQSLNILWIWTHMDGSCTLTGVPRQPQVGRPVIFLLNEFSFICSWGLDVTILSLKLFLLIVFCSWWQYPQFSGGTRPTSSFKTSSCRLKGETLTLTQVGCIQPTTELF